MARSIDQIVDVIQNQKFHFRQTDSRPQKAQKHRYERRKMREIIRLSDWEGDGQPQPAL